MQLECAGADLEFFEGKSELGVNLEGGASPSIISEAGGLEGAMCSPPEDMGYRVSIILKPHKIQDWSVNL